MKIINHSFESKGIWSATNPSQYFMSYNPATGKSVVPHGFMRGTRDHVRKAVSLAKDAYSSWRKMSRIARAELFHELCNRIDAKKEVLALAISEETGKSLNESYAEVLEALHMCQVVAGMGRLATGETYSSELATKDVQVVRKPKGVVGVISPWNFPLAIGGFWCAAPSLLEGNVVIHKPSELTPHVNHLVDELYSHFPKNVFITLYGDKDTGRELVRHPDVNVILFTGSAAAGGDIKQECAKLWDRTCSCETGSKSAVMIFEDGDLPLAVSATIASAFKLSGQRCVSAGRLLVQRSILKKFSEMFVAEAQKVQVGNPLELTKMTEGSLFCGPLISASQRDRVRTFNDLVMADEDATVLLDYTKPDGAGNFITPFVYMVEWGDKRYLKEEVFGPHVALVPFEDIDDAIRIYNDTDYGLALGAITDNFRVHRRLRDECRAGMLYINGGSIAAESHLPFGGVKKSGYGFKSAVGTVEAVTEKMVVTTNYESGKVSWAQGMR